MKNRILLALLAFAAVAGYADQALAQDATVSDENNWYVNFGPLNVSYDASSKIYLGGAQVPGASSDADSDYGAGVELGYYFNPNVAVSLTVGTSPNLELVGTGPLAGAKLGEVQYGPAVVSVHYHFTNFGPKFKPYVGIGGNYTIVLRERHATVEDLNVKNPSGAVVQLGFESDFNDRWHFFLDAKQIFLDAKATGTVGGAPAKADVTLDPLIVMTGVGYRF